MNKIPFLKVSGSHYECGKQIGFHFKTIVEKYIDFCKSDPPANLTWSDCLLKSQSFLLPTQKYFPEVIEEIKGVADGSGINFQDLFTSTIEELYSKYFLLKGCTDIVVLPPASEHTIVAHNNDLSPKVNDFIAAIEWNYDNGLSVYTVGLAGFLASVGVNNSNIVLSGNELTPTDTCVGIPRALIAKAILNAKTIDEAVNIAIHRERASSYNNIITIPGRSISIEASAKEFDFLSPKNGFLTHSNHYCSSKLLQFEGEPNQESSVKRLETANNLTSHQLKKIDIDQVKEFLKNHGPLNTPDDNSICRHGNMYVTTCGFIVDLNDKTVWLSHGNPCQNPFEKVWQY